MIYQDFLGCLCFQDMFHELIMMLVGGFNVFGENNPGIINFRMACILNYCHVNKVESESFHEIQQDMKCN